MKKQQRAQKPGFDLRLMWFLGVQLVLVSLGLLAIIFLLPDLSIALAASPGVTMTENTAMMIFVGIAVLFIFLIICLIGVFRWRLWGYWGLMIIYTIFFVGAVFQGQFRGMIGTILVIIYAFATLNPRAKFMEMKP